MHHLLVWKVLVHHEGLLHCQIWMFCAFSLCLCFSYIWIGKRGGLFKVSEVGGGS